MSTTVSRPAAPADVVVLQYAVPIRMVAIPLGILVAAVVVMTAITWTVVRGGGSGADLEYNGAVVWSLFGFVVAVGVQSVSVTFPLALALGTTRRTFTIGTLVSAAVESVMLAAAALLLLGLERLTGGWFVGAPVLADATLGGGNPLLLVGTMFGLSLTALSVGALYGAAWIRFGAWGPAGLGIASAVLLAAVLLVAQPVIPGLTAAMGAWGSVLIGTALVVVSMTGAYVLLRRASVR